MTQIYKNPLMRILYQNLLINISKSTKFKHDLVIKKIIPYLIEGKKPPKHLLNVTFKNDFIREYIRMWDMSFLYSKNKFPKPIDSFSTSNFEFTVSQYPYITPSGNIKYYDEDYQETLSLNEVRKPLANRSKYRKEKIEEALNLERKNSNLNDINYKWFRKSNYRKGYLNERYEKIGYNYTNQYQQDINSFINKYIEGYKTTKAGTISSKKDIEDNLFSNLSFQNFNDLSETEIRAMYDGTMQPAKRATMSHAAFEEAALRYGMKKTTDFRPEYFNRDILRRVDRISQTEISVAYNTANIHDSIQNGITRFQWITSPLEKINPNTCVLCNSLDRKILIFNSSPSYYKFKKTIFPWDGGFIFPPAHPYCDCILAPFGSKDNGKDWRSLATGLLAGSVAGYALDKGISHLSEQEILAKYYRKEQEQGISYVIPALSVLGIGAATILYMKNAGQINKYLGKVKNRVFDYITDGVKDGIRKEVEEKVVDYVIQELSEPKLQQVQILTQKLTTHIESKDRKVTQVNLDSKRKELRLRQRSLETTLEEPLPDLSLLERKKQVNKLKEDIEKYNKEVELEYVEIGVKAKPLSTQNLQSLEQEYSI